MSLAGYDFIKIAPQFFVNLIYMLLSFNSLLGWLRGVRHMARQLWIIYL